MQCAFRATDRAGKRRGKWAPAGRNGHPAAFVYNLALFRRRGPVLYGAIVYGCTPAGLRAALSGTVASRTSLHDEHAGHDSDPLAAAPTGRAVRAPRPSSENEV
jgi:hypothetical protein